jgi:hypothetical protein
MRDHWFHGAQLEHEELIFERILLAQVWHTRYISSPCLNATLTHVHKQIDHLLSTVVAFTKTCKATSHESAQIHNLFPGYKYPSWTESVNLYREYESSHPFFTSPRSPATWSSRDLLSGGKNKGKQSRDTIQVNQEPRLTWTRIEGQKYLSMSEGNHEFKQEWIMSKNLKH